MGIRIRDTLKRGAQTFGWKEYLFFTFWLFYFLIFWLQAMSIDAHGNLQAGHANLWGDWAVHYTMGSAMAYRELILHDSPLLLDAPFTYPFATNLIPALLIRAGVPFFAAFVVCSLFFSLVLVSAVYFFYRTFLRHRDVALMAASLFLLNGGIGFYYFLGDVSASADPIATFFNPPQEYTNYESKHIKWISVISSMILPQRAFTMGFGLALIALALIFRTFGLLQHDQRSPSYRTLLIASVILGFLPLIHAHSFLACFVILACWFFADIVKTPIANLRRHVLAWGFVLVCTSVIALPIIFQFVLGNAGNQFLSWYPGWYAKEFDISWLRFWFVNWTFVPFLAFFAVVLVLISHAKTKTFWHGFLVLFPGILLFVVPNLVLTQPWIWDNTKLLIWASVFFSGLAALALYRVFCRDGIFVGLATRGRDMIRRRFNSNQDDSASISPRWLLGLQKRIANIRHSSTSLESAKSQLQDIEQDISVHTSAYDKRNALSNVLDMSRRSLLTLMLVLMLGSGTLDAYYTLRVDLHRFTMYNQHELALADWVKKETLEDSVWLVSTKHNHWLFNLTGRQAVMTYAGWLWTHGYDYYQVEQDVKTIYRTADPALLTKYSIDYVVIDNHARNELAANDAVFRKNFNLLKQRSQYEVYEVREKPD